MSAVVSSDPARDASPTTVARSLAAIAAAWRYLSYSRQGHSTGDHFAGVRDRVRATLAYRNAGFLMGYLPMGPDREYLAQQLNLLSAALDNADPSEPRP